MEKLRLIIIGLLFLASPVWACGSYEECMEESDWITKTRESKTMLQSASIPIIELYQSRAIAFKLAEINKNITKLDGFSPCNNDPLGEFDCVDKPDDKYYGNKTPCIERQGQYYIIGTTIPISRESCSEIKKVND